MPPTTEPYEWDPLRRLAHRPAGYADGGPSAGGRWHAANDMRVYVDGVQLSGANTGYIQVDAPRGNVSLGSTHDPKTGEPVLVCDEDPDFGQEGDVLKRCDLCPREVWVEVAHIELFGREDPPIVRCRFCHGDRYPEIKHTDWDVKFTESFTSDSAKAMLELMKDWKVKYMTSSQEYASKLLDATKTFQEANQMLTEMSKRASTCQQCGSIVADNSGRKTCQKCLRRSWR